jgi:hypothetical protein
MNQHTREESSTGFTGWPPFVIMGEPVPPRDPDDDDDEEEDEEDVEQENDPDEPPFVREPDEN